MKKQVKKITKKILILSLATSLVFTSCFSHRKIEAHAAGAGAVVTLSAYTLYEICLYIGGLAVSALGIGYAYSNRDEIAEFGKSVIDSMVDITEKGWILGSFVRETSYVYGVEVLQAVKDAAWDFIQSGGLTPSTATDLTGDGYVDISDRDFELTQTKYWTTSAGLDVITDCLSGLYESWVNKDADNILEEQYGAVDAVYFNGSLKKNDVGLYVGNLYCSGYHFYVKSSAPFALYYETGYDSVNNRDYNYCALYGKNFEFYVNEEFVFKYDNFCNLQPNYELSYDQVAQMYGDIPFFSSKDSVNAFISGEPATGVLNYSQSFQVTDWIDAEGAWIDSLKDIATALRPLQDISDVAGQLASTALDISATVDDYRDLITDFMDIYVPALDVVANPIYWPDTNTMPRLDAVDLPNAEVLNPDIPIGPGDEEPEVDIDINGLSCLFNIILYIIMIIIMLILLFLACLAFIVMIFRIPASSAMLPPDMVLGFEHLKTIMIPGMNISIYGFAMALIYLFIIFAVIKALRLEINDFKIPRSFKK